MKNIRNCPKCEKEMEYSTKFTCINAEKKQSLCKSCASIIRTQTEEFKTRSKHNFDKINEDVKNGIKKNGFKGHKHSEKLKLKMSEERRNIPLREEHKAKIIAYVNTHDNPMKGKSVYSIWLEKYGKEEADNKMTTMKEKHSINNSGNGNPMHGKPSPRGSGNGWSCWYKNHFFRSLKELSFILDFVEPLELEWKTAESQQYKIPYTDETGKQRNYFADFIINDEYLVEIKPKALQDSERVSAKKVGAITFCKNSGLIYEIVDVEISDRIKELYLSGLIVPMERYRERFDSYFQSP